MNGEPTSESTVTPGAEWVTLSKKGPECITIRNMTKTPFRLMTFSSGNNLSIVLMEEGALQK